MSFNRKTLFIFILLILILVILVFLIFFYKLKTKPAPNSSSLPIKETVLNQEEYIKLRYPQASRAEQLLLTIAQQQRSATISATPENVALAEKVASQSGTLEINNCVPKPLILKVSQGNEFKISNNGPIEHRIVFLFKPLKIAPSQQLTVKSNLTSTPGLFSYDCDSFRRVGIVYIPGI